MDYLKPLIWILLVVALAIGLHLLLVLMRPAPDTLLPVTVTPGPIAPSAAPAGNGSVTPASLSTGPTTPPLVGTAPVGGSPAQPVTPALSTVDRITRAAWEQALEANGWVKKTAAPPLHTGPQYSSLAFEDHGRDVGWVYLDAGADGLVTRLEFFIDSPEAVAVPNQPAALNGCVSIVKSIRTLDTVLANLCAPVVFSPYTGDSAVPADPSGTFKGFARDVGHYIALRLTPRTDFPGGQFLLLWKDPQDKVGARPISIQFAEKCKDTPWDTFAIPPEAK
ncbi:MAG: hypothetical protein ACREJ2_05065 [Planctomycetota bacterium]